MEDKKIQKILIEGKEVSIEYKQVPSGTVSLKLAQDQEGMIEGYASVFGNVDSYGEIVDQGAFLDALKTFFPRYPKVVWAHNWEEPIGVVKEIKEDDHGLWFRAQLVLSVKRAQETYDLIKAGSVTDISFGYRVIEDYVGDDKMRHLKKLVPYEVSPVLVGANSEAMITSVKSVDAQPEEKGAVPYEDLGAAPEDEKWDAAKVQEQVWGDGANQKQYARIHVWFDAKADDEDNDGYPDAKGAYKLPHHNADMKAVWNGVKAAMGALLGSRGGVSIPDTDKEKVYNHLAKHYAEFDKEPPEMKSYSEDELKQMFDDAPAEGKEGRVLSEKNRELITRAVGAIDQVVSGVADVVSPLNDLKKDLEALLQATEAPAQAGAGETVVDRHARSAAKLLLRDARQAVRPMNRLILRLKNSSK